MKLILAAPDIFLCEAWDEYFADLPNVEIINKRFEQVQEFDCMVSPANSFGLMDGGIDAAIINFFGHSLMDRVQEHILTYYLGEQPVGSSIIIETNNPKHPYLAHTPTMRIPMDITHTDNVYMAMWGMLVAVHNHNQTQERKINSILCPGLGTGTGRVPFREAARQMSTAYKNYLNPLKYITWSAVMDRQVEIRMGGHDGFLYPMDEGRAKKD